jgi:hypothetical protein
MTIQERLDHLEEQNRTLRRSIVVISILLLCLATLGASSRGSMTDVVRARSFQVIDETGKVYARLEATAGEETGIVGSLVTLNDKGKRLTQITSNTYGAGMLVTLDGNGEELVQIAATAEGKGAITTRNGQGQNLVQLGSTRSGAGTVTTLNSDGKDLAVMTTSKGGEGMIAVRRRSA